MTVRDKRLVWNFFLTALQLRHFEKGVIFAIVIFSSVAYGEPAHCSIQANGKSVLDQVCDLVVEGNNVVKMVNSDGSYVSIAKNANNTLLATIHAIHDLVEPKLVPLPLTKEGDCYRSEDRLSHFCAHKLSEDNKNTQHSIYSGAAPDCNIYITSSQNGACERWRTPIGVNIVMSPSNDAQIETLNANNYTYVYLTIPKFLASTGQQYGFVTTGVTDFIVTWASDLKAYFATHADYMSRLRIAFSQDDKSVGDKLLAMERAIDGGSKCETITAVKDGRITYAFILMQSDKVKECFAYNIARALGVNRPTNSNDDKDTAIISELTTLYRR